MLSQALNAEGIPARRLDLLMPGAHGGFGRGHVVSEAWIDDPDMWWQYFDTANASGLMWGDTVVPIRQGEPIKARLLAGRGRSTTPT